MRPSRAAAHRHRHLLASIVVVLVADLVVLAGAGPADAEPRSDHLRLVARAALDLAATVDRPAPVSVADEPPPPPPPPALPVALPVPVAPPADPYAPTPEVRLGTIEIGRIGLRAPLFEGVTLTSIDRGPSHWPGSAVPGQLGNVVVAGHRTTFTRPFYALDRLEPGDALVFSTAAGRFTYLLEGLEVVDPTDVHIIDQRPEHTATLFACHPKGSARQRLVARFRLASAPTSPLAPLRPVRG